MTFEIEIDSRPVSVVVDAIGAAGPQGGRFRVRVGNAAAIEIDCRLTDLGVSLVHLADHRTVDAAVTERAVGEWFVQLPRVGVTAILDGRRAGRGGTGPSASGEQRLVAPMPGRILRVLVAPGDQVAARQGLIVVEAMKMENELRAARAGRVKEVAVAEGTSVEAGRLLVVVE